MARHFYQEFAQKLVFFDGGIDSNVKNYLDELSAFLEIPYRIISMDLEFIRILLKSIIYEWRLEEEEQKNRQIIQDTQSRCAEYATILDLMGKMASFTNKRDTIEKAKEIFMMVLGAQYFERYLNFAMEIGNVTSLVLTNIAH